MEPKHILKTLGRPVTPRVSVYENEKRIRELYAQRIGSISSFEISLEAGAEFESSVLGLLGITLAGAKVVTSEHELSALQKAWLLEEVERERGVLHSPDDGDLKNGDLLAFSGFSRIVLSPQTVTDETSGFPPDVALVVETRRAEQAAVLKEVIVLSARTKNHHVACIASSQFVTDLGHMCSYPSGNYGLLGRVELSHPRVLFASPVWIYFTSEEG